MKNPWFGFLVLWVIFIQNLTPAKSDKILAAVFLSTKSHKIVYEPLLYKLAERGHQVTIVTPVDSKKIVKNVREIVTVDYMTFWNTLPNFFEMREKNQAMFNPFTFANIIENLCRDSYDLPEIRSLLNETFDMVIVQPIFNDCVMGLVHHFHAPLVLITKISAPLTYTWTTGNPSLYSFVPSFVLPYTDRMSYYERMINVGVNGLMIVMENWFMKPRIEEIYREKLGIPDIPAVNKIMSNVSLILSNAHFSINLPKPYLPDIVEVGGMHCRPAKPVPKELDDFLNAAGSDGFIYFSMGSALQAHTMPEKYRKIFVNVFSKLKQKVLWKWETEKMADLPKNVKLGKWLPQQDILGHPNIKMFITHGGLGSTTEAVFHGIPLLGIPMYADQMLNMKQSENSGFALLVDFNELSEEKLIDGINRILQEKSFYDRAKYLSNLFRDQPDKPLDRAVFWTEYVLRHKGALHMRSAARDLNFFQYHSLDVIASYTVILAVILYIIYSLIRLIIKMCGLVFKKSGKNIPKKKTKTN